MSIQQIYFIILLLILNTMTTQQTRTFLQNEVVLSELQSMIQKETQYLGDGTTAFFITANEQNDSVMKLLSALLAETGTFRIKQDNLNVLEATVDEKLIIQGQSFKTNNFEYTGQFRYREINQWVRIVSETFSGDKESVKGWRPGDVTECAATQMLGGHCKTSWQIHEKKYENIPQHTILRIQAVVHFLDNWKGESMYLKVNTGRDQEFEYVWVEKYDLTQYPKAYNVCGAETGEAKFSSLVDVTIPHRSADIALEFGSTLFEADPCEKSYGISSVSIFVK